MRQLLDPPRPAGTRKPVGGDITSLVAWVAGLQQGNRNAGLYWAACRANGEEDILGQLADAAIRAGLTEDEARRTVTSVARRSTA